MIDSVMPGLFAHDCNHGVSDTLYTNPDTVVEIGTTSATVEYNGK